MKRFFILFFVLLLSLSSCNADGKKEVVTVNSIPTSGQSVLDKFFPDNKVSFVIKETELFEVEYEVRFEDGREIVFDADGIWKKIDCRKAAVPDGLVPAKILTGVQASFPGAAIVEIEKDSRGYDVELNNGMDLFFDRKFRMRIDD